MERHYDNDTGGGRGNSEMYVDYCSFSNYADDRGHGGGGVGGKCIDRSSP